MFPSYTTHYYLYSSCIPQNRGCKKSEFRIFNFWGCNRWNIFLNGIFSGVLLFLQILIKHCRIIIYYE